MIEEKQKQLPYIKYLFILDFQATCDNKIKLQPCPEIIQFSCIALNTHTLQISAQFHQYVKPKFNPQLTKFCTQLTGITQQMVQNEKNIQQTLRDFYSCMKSLNLEFQYYGRQYYKIVVCGDWHLQNCLFQQELHKNLDIPKFFRRYIDIKQFFVKIMKWKQKTRGMMEMLETLELKHQGKQHNGFDNVKNICRICVQLIKSHNAIFPSRQFKYISKSQALLYVRNQIRLFCEGKI